MVSLILELRFSVSIRFIIICCLVSCCGEDNRPSQQGRSVDHRALETSSHGKSSHLSPNTNNSKSNTTGPLKQIEKQEPKEILPRVAPPTNPAPEEEKRDLPGELKKIVGNPTHCLKPQARKDVPNIIQIQIQAHVTSNGIITRSRVSSNLLNESEVNCLQKRIENSRFKAPIQDAPRLVQTVITLQRVTPTKER